MGNKLTCMPQKPPRRVKHGSHKGSRVLGSSKRRSGLEEELLHQQALAMAIYQQHITSSSGPKPVSQRYPSSTSKQVSGLTRSSSARPRSMSDPLLATDQLLVKQKEVDNLETTHFILIHGGGFGAWCWYKSIALLEEAGFVATALDLTGSGIDRTETNSIENLAQYVKPLLDYLEKLPGGAKIILAGHSFGGACISYAMEHFPQKIAKAVFICAAMVKNGQSAFDAFAEELTTTNELIKGSQIFIYGNGNGNPPTGLEFDRSQLKELFFNQSPAKDVALAAVSMRPIPFAPVLEKISLTDENYGSIRRFFIQTCDDNVLSLSTQFHIVDENPPERVFKLKGSDHCPFFAKPQSLHKSLVEIAQLEKIA